MKKLLLVLLVVTLASFLFVGCLPTTPDGGEGEGEGEGEAGICPTLSVTTQVAVEGKNYIKGGSQTITVTFAVPTEPVSVWVGPGSEKASPLGIPDDAEEVVIYPNADKTVYTGDYTFWGDCNELYIYVITCNTCAPCKFPYTVDTVPPEATVEICLDDCTCAGCELVFSSAIDEFDCEEDEVLCGDDCSGFASWSIDIYEDYPFEECCEIPCIEPIESDSGPCPIDFTTTCLDLEEAFVVVTLVDNVGNSTRFGATVTMNPDTCDEITVTDWDADECVDTADFVICDDLLQG
jgi:hypothetical protein